MIEISKQTRQTNKVKKAMSASSSLLLQDPRKSPNIIDLLLMPIRQRLDSIDIRDAKFAKQICKLIPAQCPFERDVKLFGRTLFHIPPMCKLNPFYEQFVSLRFRSLCFLVDECGEDISAYC